IYRRVKASMRWRRSEDMPTVSGLAVGKPESGVRATARVETADSVSTSKKRQLLLCDICHLVVFVFIASQHASFSSFLQTSLTIVIRLLIQLSPEPCRPSDLTAPV